MNTKHTLEHSHCTHVHTSLFSILLQTYSAIFKVVPDGPFKATPDSSKEKKESELSFELQGEGNLPQVAIVKPNLRNAKGQPLLLFRRLLLAQSQTLPVTLQNTGTIPATVLIETISGHHSFSVSLPEGAEETSSDKRVENTDLELQSEATSSPKKITKRYPGPPPVPIKLAIGETRDFVVSFRPRAAKKCRGELCLRIQDNQFENLLLQLVGEGYEDDVCIESIRGQLGEPPSLESEELPEEVDGEVMCVGALFDV